MPSFILTVMTQLELVGVLVFRDIIHLNVPALDGDRSVPGLVARISNFYSRAAVQSSYRQRCLSIVNQITVFGVNKSDEFRVCLLYTSPSPRDLSTSRMPSSA